MLKLKETREKLEQFQDEAGMWLRTLDFIKQENNFLKNRLSAVVDNQSVRAFLAQAEHFQNQFIIKDEFIEPEGKLNILKIRPLARLGYYDYTSLESVFEMIIPGPDEKLRSGMEGKKG